MRDDQRQALVPVVATLDLAEDLGEVVVGERGAGGGRHVVVVRGVVGVRVRGADRLVHRGERDDDTRDSGGDGQAGVVEVLGPRGGPVHALLLQDRHVRVLEVLVGDADGPAGLLRGQEDVVVDRLVLAVRGALRHAVDVHAGGPRDVTGVGAHGVLLGLGLDDRDGSHALDDLGVPLLGDPVLERVPCHWVYPPSRVRGDHEAKAGDHHKALMESVRVSSSDASPPTIQRA